MICNTSLSEENKRAPTWLLFLEQQIEIVLKACRSKILVTHWNVQFTHFWATCGQNTSQGDQVCLGWRSCCHIVLVVLDWRSHPCVVGCGHQRVVLLLDNNYHCVCRNYCVDGCVKMGFLDKNLSSSWVVTGLVIGVVEVSCCGCEDMVSVSQCLGVLEGCAGVQKLGFAQKLCIGGELLNWEGQDVLEL